MIRFTRLATAAALCLALTACAVQREQQTIGTYVDDVAITTTVKAKLAADANVSATSIKVETLKGVVQLSGFAKSPAEKEAAVSVARNTKNVAKVIDSIIVVPR